MADTRRIVSNKVHGGVFSLVNKQSTHPVKPLARLCVDVRAVSSRHIKGVWSMAVGVLSVCLSVCL